MPQIRYQSLGPLPSPGGSRAFLGLAIIGEARAEPVVLVWVPEELAADVERSERIQRETERVSILEHPHIVRVYGFARFGDGRLARVVEFADGETLRRILQTVGPLPPAYAARLLSDAAQGVHYAHLAGHDDGTPLLHGDIRPDTLIVTFKGHCKVSGYGAAAFAPKDSRARNLYVAPEQVLGGRAAMNVQTDVYLLGATLYECLTGKAPFEDEPDLEQAVLSKEVDVSGLPEGLGEVIRRAMAKKAADRYPSAQVFRESLELAVGGMPDHAEIEKWLEQHFPDEQGVRAERQRMIDAGIANFVRAQWRERPIETTPKSIFPTIAPPPPVVASAPPSFAQAPAPEAPAPAPAAPAQAQAVPAYAPSPPTAAAPAAQAAVMPAPPAQPEQQATGPVTARGMGGGLEALEAEPPQRRPGLASLIVAALVIGAGAAWWFVSQREGPTGAYPPGMTTRLETGMPEPQRAGVDGGTAASQPAPVPGGAPADAGASAGSRTEDVAAAAAATAPDDTVPQGVLSLRVDPAVQVEIDGASVGRSPVRVPLSPGRHRVRLVDRRQGIDVTRYVTVSRSGTTEQEIYLQKGFVSVTAPPGAIIEIDGKNVGTAPLKGELSLYEGHHTVSVKVGPSTWRDAFTVKPNQRVYFDVGPQYR